MVEAIEFRKLLEIEYKLKEIYDRINQYDIPRTNFSAILEDENLLSIYHKKWNIIKKQINLEIAELNKCTEDVKRWPNYRLTNRIEFFIQRLKLYLKGGRDEITRETYLGLTSYFKDTDLAREIFKVSQIKKLWTYKQEMDFFSWARNVILKSLREEGEWEGFYKFYNNLRRGVRYIKKVRETFGNPEFADFLERVHEKIHEDPTVWEEDLKELSFRLHDVNYQNTYVIGPAAHALSIILQQARERLLNSKYIEKRTEDLRKHVKKLKKKFETADNKVADEMSVITPALIDLMVKIGTVPERRLSSLSKTLDIFDLWLGRYRTDARRLFAKPVIPIGGAAFFAAVQADKLAVRQFQLINSPIINQTFEFYTNQLEKRINSKLVPQLQRMINFIKEHDNEFILPISNTTNLLPEVQDLLLRNQDNLVAEFKKEGIDITKPLYG